MMRPYRLSLTTQVSDSYVKRVFDELFIAGSDIEAIMHAKDAVARSPAWTARSFAELRDDNADLVWTTRNPEPR